jgi:hypothetical protein
MTNAADLLSALAAESGTRAENRFSEPASIPAGGTDLTSSAPCGAWIWSWWVCIQMCVACVTSRCKQHYRTSHSSTMHSAEHMH